VTVNHSVTFLEEETVALTHMVESTWLQANAVLHTYSHMADYMLVSPTTIRNKFKAEGCDPFSKFLSVGGTDCEAAEDVELEAESA